MDQVDSSLRLLVTSNNAMFAEVLIRCLSNQPGIEHASYVPLGDESIHGAAGADEFDLVLLHIECSSDGEMDVAQHVIRRFAGTRVVVVGTDCAAMLAVRFIEFGAAGYVPVTAGLDELVAMIRVVKRGATQCCGAFAAAALERIRELTQSAPEHERPQVRLTARERQVLELVKAGLLNKQIAQQLNIAISTVKNHMHKILEKLGVASRSEAVFAARRWGLLDDARSVA